MSTNRPMRGRLNAPLLGRIPPWTLLFLVAVLAALPLLASCSLVGRKAGAEVELQTSEVRRGNLIVSVTASGSTSYPNQAKLSFATGGTVQEVLVRPGQVVKAGQVLARLDTRSVENTVAQARASLSKAQKALEEYRTSISPGDIAKAQAAVGAARAAVASVQNALDKARAPYTAEQIDDARFKVTSSQAGVRTAQASLEGAQADATVSQKEWNLKLTQAERLVANQEDNYRTTMESAYIGILVRPEDLYKSPAEILRPGANIVSAVQTLWNNLSDARSTLETTRLRASQGLATSQNNLKKAQDALDAARHAQAQAEQALSDILATPDAVLVQEKESQLAMSQANLQKAQEDLAQLLTGPDSVQMETLQAAVENAKSSLQDAQDKLAGATLKAPYDGAVVAVNIDPRQSVGTGVAIVVADPTQVEVSAQVDETNVAQLQIGQETQVTLDSLPGVPLRGRLSLVAPTAQVQQGVTSYLVTIALSLGAAESSPQRAANRPSQQAQGFRPGSQGTASPRAQGAQSQERPGGNPGAQRSPLLAIRAGMTATVQIVIEQRNDVLMVPLRALQSGEQGRVVSVAENSQTVSRPVEIGLTNDQYAEVLSGLKEGDRVVLPSTRGSQTQSPQGGFGGGPGGVMLPRGIR
ncbi:MAG: HlyD family efflux transporter periplasmic adaptor subunit [Chloroflexi bacterium]|nr:HlyD family efflux transporter periplasmic adaptor subunit [Chloroflexota bacterium]